VTTRLIAMGSPELTLGFGLIGFETFPGATEAELDKLLDGLVERRERALLLLEPGLARSGSAALARVRASGGRIVVAEVPALNAPGDYHPEVEELVVRVLGPRALEESA
jgi:vacuolar-type H+-ATPase subunit F/Vma7